MKFLYAFSAAVLGLPAILSAQLAAGRPPITGIAQVSVYASNMTNSLHFYGNFLGFPERGTASQRYRVSAQQTIQVDPLPPGVANHLESVVFATPDAGALRRYLRMKDVLGIMERRPDGSKLLWVKDPEGHRIGFLQASPVRARLVPVAARNHRDQVSHHILHAGFIVHNRAAEDHFFRDVLGFHQAWQGGMKDNAIDWVDRQVPNGSDWIEYMMHGPAPASAAESGVLNHFALGVSSIQKAADFLKQRGWHSSPREKAQIGRDGKWQLNLYDPDWTRVELMEFRPVQTPCCSPYTLPEPK